MPKWEYKIEFNVPARKLMQYGKLGWELVEVLRKERQSGIMGNLFGDNYKYVFKRPKTDGDNK